jgi:hypothetical protein
MSGLNINTVRCEALFASSLQRSEFAATAQVHEAIMLAVRQFGSRGCAARVAQEFGDHPETAVARMRWVQQVVAAIFAPDNMPAVARRRRAADQLTASAA